MTTERKNTRTQYNRCCAVKFALYLQEKKYLNNNQIAKKEAQQIFQQEFLQQHEAAYKQNRKFTNLFFPLRNAVLERKYEDPNILYFKPQRLDKFLGEKSEIDQFLNNNATKPRTRTVISQRFAFRKESPEEELVTAQKCKICNTKFENVQLYQQHLQDGKHNFRKTVSEKRRAKRQRSDLEFSIVGKKALDSIILRKDQPAELTLLVENVSDKIVRLLSFQIDPQIQSVTFNMEYPIDITPMGFTECFIRHTCEKSSVLYYPVVFNAEVANQAMPKQYSVELVFHVQDEFYDFLQPSSPYQRPSKPVISEVIDEIDSGEPPETSSRQKQKIPLRPNHIPPDIAYLLNSALKEFENMSETQRVQLKRIRQLMDVEDKKKCLNPHNYTQMLELLLFFEEHQMKKDIRDYDQDNQTLSKVNKLMFELRVPGLAEHRPSLILGDVVSLRESRNSGKIFNGYVHKVNQNSVQLKFSHRFANEVYVKNKPFHVSFSFNRYPIKTEHQAVNLVETNRLSPLFFPTAHGETRQPHAAPSWFNRNLTNNAEQQQAVRHILNKTSYPAPYLIFGPPGTGKTMTVVEAVKQIHKLNYGRVLICTPSNNAANEVANRLKELPTTDLFRYVAPSYPFRQIPESILKFVNHRGGECYHPDIEAVLKYRVVITTLVTAAKLYNGGCPGNHFAFVFIDESGQATETETLIPITAVLAQNNKIKGQIVLAGDPKQLGPIIHSPIAKDFGFDVSMLERLMGFGLYSRSIELDKYDACHVTKLLKNYRSHPVLIKQSNELFYDDELVTAGDDMINVAVGWEELPNKDFPMLFYSVKGVDQREAKSPSFFNVQEIEIVCKYLDLLIGSTMKGIRIKSNHIGIISPYKKQVEKISMACQKKGYDDGLSVGTIEQFQGEERLIIIISTVRSRVDFLTFDYKHHLGFLKNPKRMNVALTRAKALTIIIGNPDILQNDLYWRSVIEYCQKNRAVLGEKFELTPLENESGQAEGAAAATAQLSTLEVTDTEDGPNFSRGNQ